MSTVGKMLLVLLLVLVSSVAYGRYIKGGIETLSCKNSGGECTAGTCNYKNQIAALGDKAAGCNSGEICCINITKSVPPVDPLCTNKSAGDKCNNSNLMYCDLANKCVSKCEFCSKLGTEYKAICGNDVFNDKYDYSCSCSECDATMEKEGLCVRGYCLGNNICCDTNEVAKKVCNEKNYGDSCGDKLLCGNGDTCIDKCTFCSLDTTNHAACQNNGMDLNQDYSCQCSESECEDEDGKLKPECISGYCPSNNPESNNYRCCTDKAKVLS